MSGRVRSRSRSKQRKDDPRSNQHMGEQQPSDEQLKQKEAPPESQDILPDQGKEVEGGPVAQGRDLEADLQKLPQAKAGCITEDDPNVKAPSLPFLEPIKMPEAGEGLPQI
ncbi:P antigen family member 3-like [Neomonachus schauinslandi]|uniref:P antigen family member 3-like n=1 Tax=Neomonachus schauinslandi TaxID=29088 RepID=A0A8M1M9Y4_NEOSC|nr:P antigen family member 3-like [Neomonachus schauinslandi]